MITKIIQMLNIEKYESTLLLHTLKMLTFFGQ
jgi:hypothetical protein